jgi:hypothetical protein
MSEEEKEASHGHIELDVEDTSRENGPEEEVTPPVSKGPPEFS